MKHLLLAISLNISLAAFGSQVTLQSDKTAITEGDSITCTVTRTDAVGDLIVKYAVGEPIVKVASVSVSSDYGKTAKNLIDGRLDTYWMSAGNIESSNARWTGKDDAPFAVFTFDRVHSLQTLRVANFAMPRHTFRGAKDVLIETSADGATFTSLGVRKLRKGPDAKESVFEELPLEGVAAKAVRLSVKTNYGNKEFGKGTSADSESPNVSYVGLNEVEFLMPDGASNERFEKLPGAVTIPSGQLSASFTVKTIDDKWIQGPQNLEVRLISGDAYTLSTPSSAMIAIADNDAGDEVSIAATTPTAYRTGQRPGVFTFKRKGTTGALTVHYDASTVRVPISAVNCSDFRSRDGATPEKVCDGDLKTCWATNGNAEFESEEIDDPWIVFSFDRTYTLGKMRVANYVCPGASFRGMKTVEVLTATEMLNFTSQGEREFKRGADKAAISEFETIDLGGVEARRVMFRVKSNFDRQFGKGVSFEKYPHRSIVGLAEVEFYAGGSAGSSDYREKLTGSITFPDGQDTVTLTITPTNNQKNPGARTVDITLIPDLITYTAGAVKRATITIQDE